MEITAAQLGSNRSRSRSRTRNSTANSRSTSATRRPSIGPRKRSLSSTSSSKLSISSTNVADQEKPIPTTTACLDNSLPLDFFKQDLIALIKAIKVSKWHKKNLSQEFLIINRISGALTNSIYKIEYKDPEDSNHPPALLLRVYGKNVDSIIDREVELANLVKLSQKRIGPKLLGIFGNGRFEQFLDGYITLNKDQIRDEVISQMLARRMKDLHYKIALDIEDQFAELPMSWRLIYKWLDFLQEQFTESKVDSKDLFFIEIEKFRDLIEIYREWLFSQYGQQNFSQNYKFCHNDAQYGNLLLLDSFDPKEIIINNSIPSLETPAVNSETNSARESVENSSTDIKKFGDQYKYIKSTTNKKDDCLAVIDFEYSGANFPAYDLVNHFCEWMGDYHDPEKSYYIEESRYPSKLEQMNFIKSYVEYDFQYPSSNLKTKNPKELNNISNVTELMEFEIKKIYNECVIWRCTNALYWGLWGLIQNGPFEQAPVEPTPDIIEEQGIDSTYSITTSLDNLQLENANANLQENNEQITSSDDDFNYVKYAQQKFGIFFGDMIQFGLLDEQQLSARAKENLKYLDTKLFEL